MGVSPPSDSGHARIVIVAYRSSSEIIDCIEPLLHDPDIGEIVVVDNSNEINCREIVNSLPQDGPIVRYIGNETNSGFARACNAGATSGPKCDFLVFLNPDVVLDRQIGPLLELAKSRNFSIVSASLGDLPHHLAPNARRATTAMREIRKAVFGSSHYYYPTQSHDDLHLPDQVDGAFMVMTWDVYAASKGFDERFELYYEDVAMCDAARQIAPIALNPKRWGYHAGGKSFGRSPGRVAYAVLRVSRVRYLRLRYGMSTASSVLALTIGVLEYLARTIGRGSEGKSARMCALRAQFREVFYPGKVKLLEP